ncbi:molybdenum cofactor guanylyltransferase MobA [Thioclava sp. GXIMD4216]|uniref:molybdenum cofactor guanylyltransferase MobA n=1 Tax=Thioclava sp. GXIMD4216 TaxID=3131929 RepID=UPI0030D312AD
MEIFGLILAGGEGRRMGGVDKAWLSLGGQPLLAHVHNRLAPQVARLAVSANGTPERFTAWCKDLPVLPDPPAYLHDGPLAGILAGLDWASLAGAAGLVTVAVDTPFIPADLVARLVPAGAGAGAQAEPAQAVSQGRGHPTLAYWPCAWREQVVQALAAGERRLGARLARARRVEFADLPDPFFNINTPEDLQLAQARHDALGTGK